MEDGVEFAPELLRKRAYRGAFSTMAFETDHNQPQKIDVSANVEAALPLTDMVLLLLLSTTDSIFNTKSSKAPGKLSFRRVTRKTNDPLPGPTDKHGHACAESRAPMDPWRLWCSTQGQLLPIRRESLLGSQMKQTHLFGQQIMAQTSSQKLGTRRWRSKHSSDPPQTETPCRTAPGLRSNTR
jgi:hypothetical protein